jgi:trehalose-6-phosphate synthase
MTPGATTDHEKIFKPFYTSRSVADEPHVPGPNEPRLESWGLSRKFNQPKSNAVEPPEASILSRQDANVERATEPLIRSLDGQDSESDPEDTGSPRVFLSEFDWVVKAAEQGNGGLRNAVNAAAQAGIVQDKVWVGTLGMPTDRLKEHTRTSIAARLQDEFESLAVFVSDSEFEGHYSHFCRTVLWPAFHYQMQESPRRKEYDDHSWRQYVKVNEAFADAVVQRWKPGDRIWVHDYHLLLLPAMLRKRLPEAEIGFFMHTAFPSSEVFRCLTTREALLKGLLGADLIGFQTEEYCQHFLHTCSRLLRLEVSPEGVHLPDRLIPVQPFPIGIDSASLNTLRQSPEVREWISKIQDRYAGKRLVVARDRLDAAGGIKQKLLAYEMFLRKYPKWRDSVSPRVLVC